MRWCLTKAEEFSGDKDLCCGFYDSGDKADCWLTKDDSISMNRGAHRAIMIGNEEKYRTFGKLTTTGLLDLASNEISTSTGVNDIITEVEISVYPDGVNKAQVRKFTSNMNLEPRVLLPMSEEFYILASNA